jgi:hypothetical protein
MGVWLEIIQGFILSHVQSIICSREKLYDAAFAIPITYYPNLYKGMVTGNSYAVLQS